MLKQHRYVVFLQEKNTRISMSHYMYAKNISICRKLCIQQANELNLNLKGIQRTPIRIYIWPPFYATYRAIKYHFLIKRRKNSCP